MAPINSVWQSNSPSKIGIPTKRNRSKTRRPRKIPSDTQKIAKLLLQLFHRTTIPAVDVTLTTNTNTKSPLKNTPHTCDVCGKIFQSHQALGGHKASHRVKTPALADGKHNTVSSNYKYALNHRGKPHNCSICGDVFPTGQALGGHMRKHYEGITGRAKIGVTSAMASRDGSIGVNSTEFAASSSRVVRDFDLNLPAEPELDWTLRPQVITSHKVIC